MGLFLNSAEFDTFSRSRDRQGYSMMKKLTPVTNFFSCIYTHSVSQDRTLGVHAEKIEDLSCLLRVKCRLSNYENSSTFKTVL